MRTEGNITRLMIADGLAHADGDKIADLTDDELGIVCVKDASGTLSYPELFTDETDDKVADDEDEFRFMIQRADGTTEVSDIIKKSEITSLKVESYSAPTEQISYIGYNATDDEGSIEVINDNGYYASITFFGATVHEFARRDILPSIYQSKTSGNTQYSISAGLVNTFITNMKYYRAGYKPVVFDVVTPTDNDLALGTGVGTLTFTKGSNVVTADTDIDDATTNAALAVGDLIRNGTSATDAVYKITAIDTTGNTITLDRDVTVASSGDDANYKKVASANVSTQAFGVKITGNTADSVPGYINFEPVDFETGIFDMGDDTNLAKKAQVASRGIGSYQYMKQLEAELAGNDGIQYRSMPTLNQDRTSRVAESDADKGGFDVVSIEYIKETRSPLGDKAFSKNQLLIAIDEDAAIETNIKNALGGEV